MEYIKEFETRKVQSHRNGISGRPFYAIYFSYRDGQNDHRLFANMMAVIPCDSDELKAEEVCVVDLNDIESCFRGTYFYYDIVKAIEKYRVDLSAKLGLVRAKSA